MAYGLYAQSYGLSFANGNVLITEANVGTPAIILDSPTGGVVNANGQAKLDQNGNLQVYIDLAIPWSVAVFDGITQAGPPPVLQSRTISPQEVTTIKGVPGTMYVLDRVPYTRFLGREDGTLLPMAGGTGNADTFQYDNQKRITSFNLSGMPYMVSYPDSSTIVVAGDSIATTIVKNPDGTVQSVSRTFY